MDGVVLWILICQPVLISMVTDGAQKGLKSTEAFIHNNPADIIPELDKYPQNDYSIESNKAQNGEEGKKIVTSLLDRLRNGGVFETVKSIIPYGLQSDGLSSIMELNNVLKNDGQHIIKVRKARAVQSYRNEDLDVPFEEFKAKGTNVGSTHTIAPETSNLKENPDLNQQELQNQNLLQQILQFNKLASRRSNYLLSQSGDPLQNEPSNISSVRYRIIPGILRPRPIPIIHNRAEGRKAFDEITTTPNQNIKSEEDTLKKEKIILEAKKTKDVADIYENSTPASKQTDDKTNKRYFEVTVKTLGLIFDYVFDKIGRRIENENNEITVVININIYNLNNLSTELEL